jgi:hypothetical protein
MDVAAFFEEAIPALARERPEVFGAARGRVCVREKGGRSWTVALGDADVPVTTAGDVDAELVLSFTAGALEAFVGGTLDVEEAVAQGEVAYDGDIELLVKLGYLLSGARRDPAR